MPNIVSIYRSWVVPFLNVGSATGAASGDIVGSGRLTMTGQPSVTAYRTTQQTFLNGTSNQPVTYEGSDQNVGSIWAGAGGGLFAAPVPGTYYIFAQVSWTANGTGVRYMQLNINGVLRGYDEQPGSASVDSVTKVQLVIPLAASDQITFGVNQTSGGSLASLAGGLKGYVFAVVHKLA
jgi:hypothetical protein